jgi:hypothetical protein
VPRSKRAVYLICAMSVYPLYRNYCQRAASKVSEWAVPLLRCERKKNHCPDCIL